MKQSAYYQFDYKGFRVLVERGTYRLKDHQTRFPDFDGIKKYINDLEKLIDRITNNNESSLT